MTPKKDGFEGPASPKVDYTGIPYYLMERDLLGRLKSWLEARFLALNSPMLFGLDKAFGPVSALTREVISFHSISKPWGHLKWKIFVKDMLVERLCDFYQYTLDTSRDRWNPNTRSKHFVDIDCAARMGSDLYLVGTVLAGLTKTESAGLYRALMGMLMYKKQQRKLKYRKGSKKEKIEIFPDEYTAAPARCITIHPKRYEGEPWSSRDEEDWMHFTDDSDLEDESNDEDMSGTEKDSGDSTEDDDSEKDDHDDSGSEEKSDSSV